MLVVITGASSGVGLACVQRFVSAGYMVCGIDTQPAGCRYDEGSYHHIICEESWELPDIQDVSILINAINVQNSGHDIDTNLKWLMKCTEKYGLQPDIRAIVNISDASAHQGTNFPEYVASKGGVNSYTKWVAKEVAKYHATCNSISLGGVLTELNSILIDDKGLWSKIMELTPLKSWATTAEIAEWVYFLAVMNKSCSGQDIMIDSLESLNGQFIWV